jgi:hypothetical protein
VYLRIKFKIYFFPIYINFLQRKSIILLGLKALSELNILLKLLNKLFLFLIEMKTSNYLVRDLLTIPSLKVLSFCILDLFKSLLSH